MLNIKTVHVIIPSTNPTIDLQNRISFFIIRIVDLHLAGQIKQVISGS